MDMLDLSFLSQEERDVILAVIERDERLREAEAKKQR